MSSSAETRREADPAAIAILNRVVAIADQSSDRDEFLRLLAADAAEHFGGALVAITAGHWPKPMWLVADDLLEAQIQRPAITSLLSTAEANPIACSIPLQHATSDGSKTSRGIRVELTSTPDRAAMVVVYPIARRIDSLTQLSDLKSLRTYREATTRVISQVPVAPIASRSTSRGMTIDADGLHRSTGLAMDRGRLCGFHTDLNLSSTAYRIANESRRLLDCDRVTVLVRGPRALTGRPHYRVAAVSGVAVVDRRSNAIRSSEALVNSAVVMSRPLTFPSVEPLPPQIEGPIDEYLDQNGVGTAAMLPLFPPADPSGEDAMQHGEAFDATHGEGNPLAVLLIEQFGGVATWHDDESPADTTAMKPVGQNRVDQTSASRLINPAAKVIANEAVVALRNSARHSRMLGHSLTTTAGNVAHDSRRWLYVLAAAVVMGLVAAACLIETNHYVVTSGTIQPNARREVFAPIDGVIMDVSVQDGETVTQGQVLIKMENPDLQSQSEVLTGKIATASEQIDSIASARLDSRESSESLASMAIEQRQLQSELVDLSAQLAIVNDQLESLAIRSPIDGVVSAWQIDRRLRNRPVSRGNALLTVVDPTKNWQLRLALPTDDAGAVVREMSGDDTRLPATFAIATDVDKTHAAVVEHLATTARSGEDARNTIEVIANVVAPIEMQSLAKFAGRSVDSISDIDRTSLRPDVDVTAKIFCGRRSYAASWFDDAIRFYHRNIAFYF